MAAGELDDFLRDERQMAHVTKSHIFVSLRFITPSLALHDLLCYSARDEYVNGQRPVEAPVDRAIEHLLHNIIHNIVEKVVPWETEEEVL